MRTYVKIVKEGEDDDLAEVPTNSEGLLPEATVTALFEGTSAIKYKVMFLNQCFEQLDDRKYLSFSAKNI